MERPTFTLPEGIGVDVGAAIEIRPRIRRAQFGDGYSQRSGDGLNAIGRKVDVSFSLLGPAQSQEIEAFFIERAGYRSFMWTPPHETSSRQWICTEWRKTFQGPEVLTISARFEETFDP